MASKLFSLIALLIFIDLPFFARQSCAIDVAPVPPETICKYTPYPSYCKTALPNNQTTDVHTYCQFTFGKALSQPKRFLNLIDQYLTRRSILPINVIRALEDCHLLACLSMDYLLSSYQTINNISNPPTMQVDDVHTLLSALLTNQQTCLDGLQSLAAAQSIKYGLSFPLSDDSKLFSVLLALFKKGWVGEKQLEKTWQLTRTQTLFRNGHLPLQMSDQNRAIYNSVSKRKLNSSDDAVKVTAIVTVCKDGRGNFSTITDAVNAAPNNTDASKGYFLIYITAGVYEEYISIPKNKINLMMIGDGIGKTIITGNRSVDDGWTTFNSATFGNCGGTKFCGGKHNFPQYSRTKQFYRECNIYGTVDFIFGNAAVVFQNCNIYPRLPLSGQFNIITAQGRTNPNQNTGTSIHDCIIKASDDLASSNGTVQTYLGRPWKEYSRTVYMQSFMDSSINPAGWSIWSGDFALNTLYYAEYNNTGPGSNTTDRVTWPGYHVINATDAADFTVANFLSGNDWLPKTGVPYTPGL